MYEQILLGRKNLEIGRFQYIKIHTFLQGLGKQNKK